MTKLILFIISLLPICHCGKGVCTSTIRVYCRNTRKFIFPYMIILRSSYVMNDKDNTSYVYVLFRKMFRFIYEYIKRLLMPYVCLPPTFRRIHCWRKQQVSPIMQQKKYVAWLRMCSTGCHSTVRGKHFVCFDSCYNRTHGISVDAHFLNSFPKEIDSWQIFR